MFGAHLIEQDADEVVGKAEQWADTLENAGLAKGLGAERCRRRSTNSN
jgi:hypothetical protein